ncbi:MAG: hypothetical protein ACD_3C00010G0005 [uncultured bacterium (gcode 4)]|uniref:Peptidase M16 protein n=1 Tax=uncultured bacterium (gcode 4) TaxID=1234023 RepID=K2FCK9_9BACT|nr:MAG: hypothetical protein ACD_3C00010G0005 [uncultured bacterium (gcode 4)]
MTLANGLRIIVIEMPHLFSAEIGIHFGSGSIDDPKDKEGVAHLVEHLLFRGTKICPKPEILDAEFEIIGGGANAGTDEETTCYFSRVHPSYTDRGIELISSMILTPLLKDMAIEKRTIIQEVLENLNSKKENICPHEVVHSLLWPDSKLGTPVIGQLGSIRKTTLGDVKEFIKDHYTPDNAVLCVAGKVDAQEVFASAVKYFSSWTGKRKARVELLEDSEQNGPKISFVKNPDSQFSVSIGFKGFPRFHELTMISNFTKFSLCQTSGRLYTNVRGRNGLVYHIDSETSIFPNSGGFFVNFQTEPKNVVRAIEVSLEELWLLAEKQIGPEELRRYINSYIFELDFSQESSSEIQMRYGSGEILNYIRTINDDKIRVSSITSEMIQETAKLLFSRRNLHIAVVGPMRKKVKTEIESLIANLK